MTNHTFTSSEVISTDFTVFEAAPGMRIVFLPDAPRFTIIAATRDICKDVNRTKEQLVGKGVFEVYPFDPADPGESELRASLAHVLQYKEPHQLPIKRYDKKEADGSFSKRYWKTENFPVVSAEGQVSYIIHTTEDITEQAQTGELREKMKGLEQVYNIFLQAPVAMCTLRGPSHIVEIANERMYELWGKSKEELIGKSIFDGLPEVRNQGYEDLLHDVFTTGRRFTTLGVPVALPRNNSIETVYINFQFEAYREGDGSISGILVVATDVTELVRAQRSLEESEATLQQHVAKRTADLEEQKGFIASILESSLDGIYALKAVRNTEGVITDFQYLFANNHIAKQLHLEAQEIIGSSMLALLPENRTNGFFDLFCKLLETGETFRDETHFMAQSIDSWYKYVIVPLDHDTVVVSIEDITEKKQASLQIEEQRNLLESILQNSSNGISVSQVFRDERGQVVDALTILANEAAVKYIGLPKDLYLSKRATEIEPAVIGSPYFHACINTLNTGEPFVMQYQMHSTGKWLELTVSKLDDNHLIQIFTDVTPIKEAQLQMEKYIEDLKRSNKNLEEFAYAVSHDLKAPTRKIHYFSERLKDSLRERLTESEKNYINRMELASNLMNALIDDLLTYSAVSQTVLVKEAVDMNILIDQVLSDLDLEIEQKGAIIEVDPLFTIQGHRRQLQQAFQNLIGNALKYSKPDTVPVITIQGNKVKGGETGLQLSLEEQERDYCQVSVRDHGIGFDQADAERIFNVFTRLHGMAEYKGTGVGLAIVRKVIENHQGYVWAESQPGEGAVFHIVFQTE